MPEWRIRVTGKQRTDVDVDLLVQALIMIGDERCSEEHGEAQEEREPANSDDSSGAPV